jgi:integration host factor subunit beta
VTAPAQLTRQQLLYELRNRTALLTIKDADVVLDTLENIIAEALQEGRVVKLPGFLQLQTVTRPERPGRNPRTGETITIPAKRVVRIKVLKKLVDKVAAS